MEKRRDKSFSEMSTEEVIQKLSFLDADYVRFWMDNPDFRLEYKRLYEFGINGRFYRFFLAATNVLAEMRLVPETDFDFATAVKSIHKMEKLLHGPCDDRLFDHNLLFMLNKLSAPYQSIKYWLTVPEFVSEMQERVACGGTVDNRVALDAMERIFAQKEIERDRVRTEQNKFHVRTDFSFKFARRAIRSIRKALGYTDPLNAQDPELSSVSITK